MNDPTDDFSHSVAWETGAPPSTTAPSSSSDPLAQSTLTDITQYEQLDHNDQHPQSIVANSNQPVQVPGVSKTAVWDVVVKDGEYTRCVLCTLATVRAVQTTGSR